MRIFSTTQHPKGNIMILVLFVMFVSALLGLLISQYVQNLITVSRLYSDYYKGYYHAYGGLELGLAQVREHGYGFEDTLVYSGFSACRGSGACQFSMDIAARQYTLADSASLLADCDAAIEDESMFEIPAGDGLIVPLFWDSSDGFAERSYTMIPDNTLVTMNPMLYNTGVAGEDYSVQVIDEDLENYNNSVSAAIGSPSQYGFANDLSGYVSDLGNKNYLVIAHSTGDLKKFCIDIDTGTTALPSKYIVIDSIGRLGNTTISLSATKVNQLPSYLLYSALE